MNDKKKQERREVAAGCVVFSRVGGRGAKNKGVRYLLLRAGSVWGFPKGRLRRDEHEEEAALREAREETGTRGIVRVPGFRTAETYFKPAHRSRTNRRSPEKRATFVFKVVTYFLAAVSGVPRPRLSSEHDEGAWVEKKKALELLQYPGRKKVLELADAFIGAIASKDGAQKVYACTSGIPVGKVATYKDIARCAGVPARSRWVGWVLNKNSDPSVPCHRVVESSGRIGGFNSGSRRKVAILEREGVCVDNGKIDLVTYSFYPHG